MMKHIGRHDQRKAVVLFKELPNDVDEMCLIVYTDTSLFRFANVIGKTYQMLPYCIMRETVHGTS